MKRFFACMIGDLKKTIHSQAFLLCVIVTFLLCFSNVAYIGSGGLEYSVLEAILHREKAIFSGLYVTKLLTVSTYLTMFLPILSAMPFVSVFCSERLTGNMRFQISRVGRYPYYMAKFVSAVLSGGVTILLGYVLYALVLCFFFPIGQFDAAGLLIEFGGILLYGMFSVMPAFFFSSFIKNKYMICCLPFILLHFYDTMLSRLQSYFTQKENWQMSLRIVFLYPDSVKNLTDQGARVAVPFQTILAVLALIGFLWIMNRWIDYGE